MTVTVSPARADDFERWRELFRGYGEFHEVELTDADFDRAWSWINDPQMPTRCLLARDEHGTPIGLAHYRPEHSPLRGTFGFLDDLYVDPARRGSGVVDALLGELRSIAKAEGWGSVRWRTAENNYRARAVYDKYAVRSVFLTYVMPVSS